LAIPSVQSLLESGVHFGHQTSRWNPKMKSYIFGRKNVIHIIDLKSTLRGLIRAANLLKNVVALGRDILYVGTKRQARSVILEEAGRSGMPYVSDRWLGGTLTNFLTIRSRLKRLTELESLEESGKMLLYSKKEVARFRRELHKLHRNLTGIREMAKLPGALVVVDPGRENIAVREAVKLGIPVIGLVDTDTDPGLVDIVIPCNDDAFRSIKIVLMRLTDSVIEGKAIWEERRVIDQKASVERREAARPQKPRRTSRGAGQSRGRRSTGQSRGRAAPKKKSEQMPADSKDQAKKAPEKALEKASEKVSEKPEPEAQKPAEPEEKVDKTEAKTEK